MNYKGLATMAEPAPNHFITIKGDHMNLGSMAKKVMEDIQFLQDRIDRIKQLQTPNSSVLKTYQSMLASREEVLTWIQINHKNQVGDF